MKTTIKDVARQSGVSISTVSKVINGSRRISDKTAEKVKAVMRALDYHPNSMARNLVKQQSRNLCIIKGLGQSWDASINPYVYEIINGIEYKAREADYLLSILNVDEDQSLWPQLEPYVLSRRVDGFLIFAALAGKDLLKKLKESNVPLVVIGEPDYETTACWVDLNNEVAGRQALEYLMEEYPGNYLYVRGGKEDHIGEKRLRGIKKLLKESGKSSSTLTVKTVAQSYDHGFHFANDILEHRNYSGIISSGSICAAGILEALRRKEIGVPDDLALISFDKYPVSQLTRPALSVIDMDLKELGSQCCTTLLKRMEDPGLVIQLIISASSLLKGGSA